MSIDNKEEEPVRDQFREKKLMELVELQSEYIKFLDTEYKPFLQIGIIHGMRFTKEAVEKGQDIRGKIELAKTWLKMLK